MHNQLGLDTIRESGLYATTNTSVRCAGCSAEHEETPATMESDSDTRLTMAIQLLRSLVEQRGGGSQGAERLSPLFVPPTSGDSWLSATDLMNWWFRPAWSTADPWDDYFGGPGGSVAQPLPQTPDRTRQHRPRAPRFERSVETSDEVEPFFNLEALIAPAGDDLADELAQEAVDCLYDFVHALGRRDVDAAMALVDEEYHALEGDLEIDALRLRHQMESFLEYFRGWDLEVSLAEIPRPLRHPLGILIYVEIAFDGYRVGEALRRSLVERRLALLVPRDGRRLLISALSPVDG